MAVPLPRIFLSHSSKDHDFCVRLVEDLRRILGDDDAVWCDGHGGLQGGDAWWSKIERELDTRTIFIVILSPDAVVSDWVDDEINIAWQRKNDPDPARKMRLVPVLYRACEIRQSLKSLQVVSFLPPKSYEAALQEILTALGLPAQPPSDQNPPPVPQNPLAASVGSQPTIAPQLRTLAARPKAIEVLRTLTGHTDIVNSVALSADGLMLTSGSLDRTIKLWNTQTGQLLRTLTGHTRTVYSVALSVDRLTLASGSEDGTVKLWEVKE